MLTYQGNVLEIRLDGSDKAAWIACPPAAIPQPGQYLSAWSPLDQEAAISSVLFVGEIGAYGFLAVPPIPTTWEPGTPLVLRGPLGRGFQVPATARRLALVALDVRLSRLLPLGLLAIQSGTAVALFTDCTLPSLPAAMEGNPLGALRDAYTWADFIAIDLAIEQFENLRQMLLLARGERLPCPAEVLVVAPMPCAGLADCGACGVPARRSWKMSCQDGPVFDLEELEW
jgi:NAD(P)H-flavin reductase